MVSSRLEASYGNHTLISTRPINTANNSALTKCIKLSVKKY